MMTAARQPPSSDYLAQLDCKRPQDCRCNRPLPDPDRGSLVPQCPRDRSCVCQYTWCDTRWIKGDDHTSCVRHHPGPVVDLTADLEDG